MSGSADLSELLAQSLIARSARKDRALERDPGARWIRAIPDARSSTHA
jgi:hypothetical protein